MSRSLRYRVIRKLAHGGMAEIFLAMQIGAEGFEKPVVLKRILPGLASDPGFVRMLVDEAHIASSLSHSHLVQVLDLGKAGDEFFLVLEFVDGWSLEQVRRRARKARLKMPLPLQLYIVSALCRALDYVHRRTRNGKPLGIVHRDVTPQNVLLSREGEVKLADFGIAKAVGRREKSATGVIKGKFAYMSPEQAIGGELDARSDLFSVGTLLYVLATGRKPFDGATDLDVLMQVRRARYEKPSNFMRDFNPDVERFIARALRADRNKRWQSAEQMADRLDAILVKLGQPTGPAALKRWLDNLSSRDGVLPPGDVRETALDAATGTMALVSKDLELQNLTPQASATAQPRAAAQPEAAAQPDDEEPEEISTARETMHARTQTSAAGEVKPLEQEVKTLKQKAPVHEAVTAIAALGGTSVSVATHAVTVVESAPDKMARLDRLLDELLRSADTKSTPPAPELDAREAAQPPTPAPTAEDSAEDGDQDDEQTRLREAPHAHAAAPGPQANAPDALFSKPDEPTSTSPAPEAEEPGALFPPYAEGEPDDYDEFTPSEVDASSLEKLVANDSTPPLLLTQKARPRTSLMGRLTRALLGAALLAALLGGGAYFASPYLPAGVIPAEWERTVETWVARARRSLEHVQRPLESPHDAQGAR